VRNLAQEFANWLWGRFFPPVVKPWCAIFYFVAQEFGIETPTSEPGDIDDKLLEAVNAIKQSAFDHSQLHVVYRAIWRNAGDPQTTVVGSLLPSSDYPNYDPPGGGSVDLGQDLPHFLEWVYKWCPAKHYAIFFWGHSCGPAGLFRPAAGVKIPPPLSLDTLKTAFDTFQVERSKGLQPARGVPRTQGTHDGPPAGGPGGGQTAAEVIEQLAGANPKVEIALFQDCWMSTLETAYQLKDVVQYAIASQSLLPIGLGHPQFKWDYQKMLAHLFNPNFDKDLFADVAEVYSTANLAGIDSALTSVPLSLLDLSAVEGLTVPMGNLVTALSPRGDIARASTFAPAVIIDFNPKDSTTLSTGDAGLIDLVKLCKNLGTDPDPQVRSAAAALLVAIGHVVRALDERGPEHFGYGGLSVLYYPKKRPLQDEYILGVVLGTFYRSLIFQTAFTDSKRWPALEHL
jgi:hypothetical protein